MAVAAIVSVIFAEVAVLWQHIGYHLDVAITLGLSLLIGITVSLVALRDLDWPWRLRGLLFGLALAIPAAILFEFAFGRLGIVTAAGAPARWPPT